MSVDKIDKIDKPQIDKIDKPLDLLAQANSPIPAITRRTKAGAKKYRPSLTATQVQTILMLAKTHSVGLTQDTISLISTLAPFMAKIENEGIAVAYTTMPVKPSTTSLEALGAGAGAAASLGAVAPIDTTYIAPPNSLDKEAYWEQCYQKYTVSPIACSLVEIEAAQEWRYLNDLMTADEEESYERK